MADYLPAPSFNLGYTTPLTDIGKGYAEGISKMGESIGGTITGLLGGINPKQKENPEDVPITLTPTKTKQTDVPPTHTAEQVEAELHKRFFFNPATSAYEPLQSTQPKL